MGGLTGANAEPTDGTEHGPATFFESIRRGERQAIERAYREHHKDVERSVRNGLRRAGRLTPANVSDVVQEVFAKAFSERARARYDGTRAFGPYLQRIAGNVLVDWLRRSRRQITSDVGLDSLEGCDDFAYPTCELFPQDFLDVARSYITTLGADLRRVHELRFVAGEGQLDAARCLGISRQKLRTLERKLVDGLRHELESAGARGEPA
jgi:RNA polymerase sigma factor (sigma-70 family)